MTDIFDEKTIPVVDPTKDYLAELVGENRPYKTPADLARAAAEKEAYIKRLEAENAGIRTELSGRIKLEEVLTRIETTQSKGTSNPEDETPVRVDTPPQPDFEKLIEDKLNQKEAKRRFDANADVVRNKLLETYGPNYATRVQQELASLGMSPQEGNAIAVQNPQAFFKLLGVGQAQQVRTTTPPVSTSSFAPTSGSQKTYSHYEKLRKEKPTEYWSPRTQNEMIAQLRELGQEEFYR